MTFVSCFAGMGGFDMGLTDCGMECVLQIENDKNCVRVLERHHPDVRRKRDIRRAKCKGLSAGLVCGGSPCQDLSVAGKRAGLAGKRSGLFFHFLRVVGEIAPRWVLWENVPGAFSSNDGRDFLVIVNSLVQLGYGVAVLLRVRLERAGNEVEIVFTASAGLVDAAARRAASNCGGNARPRFSARRRIPRHAF